MVRFGIKKRGVTNSGLYWVDHVTASYLDQNPRSNEQTRNIEGPLKTKIENNCDHTPTTVEIGEQRNHIKCKGLLQLHQEQGESFFGSSKVIC